MKKPSDSQDQRGLQDHRMPRGHRENDIEQSKEVEEEQQTEREGQYEREINQGKQQIDGRHQTEGEHAAEHFNEIPDDWFDDEDEEPYVPLFQRKGVRKAIAFIFSLALVANILAFWPQVYSLAAIQFLVKSQELSQLEEIQAYKEAVVIIRAGESKGTGFNIAPDGLIVTNHHVIEGGEKSIVVTFPSDERFHAEVLISDAETDIALLAIEGEQLPMLPLAAENQGKIGEPIYVIGNPLFFNQIANEGHFVGTYQDGDGNPIRMMLDAPIYKGNSGSPVINQDGQVIAVVYATTRVQLDGKNTKVGLAVPIHDVKQYIEDLELYPSP